MVARATPSNTIRSPSRRFNLTGTFRAGEPSWLLTWICKVDANLRCLIRQNQKARHTSGPHGEIKGVAWFEVLYRVLEGHHIGRLHNFNASLLCVHQIAACVDKNKVSQKNTGSGQARAGLLDAALLIPLLPLKLCS